MIDITRLTTLDWPSWEAARTASLATSPPTPILVGKALQKSFSYDLVDGGRYVVDTDIPIVFVGEREPPPRVRPVVDLVIAIEQRTEQVQLEVREKLDAVVTPQDRERSVYDLLRSLRGLPVSRERIDAATATLDAIAKADDETERVTALVKGAADVAAVEAVTVDLTEIEVQK